MIVVVILGILASLVIPKFISAADTARQNSIMMTLHRMRSQIGLYQQQHLGSWPTLANIVNEMTLVSDALGNTAPLGTPGFQMGPYITFLPNNPNTGTATIGNVGGGGGASDWYYNEATGEFRANDSLATWAL